MKRAPLRPRSQKRASEMIQRRKLVKELLERFPQCARCHSNQSVDLHELKNRSQGGDFLDAEQIVTLCRECHRWVTENPLKAHGEGWTFWSHEVVVKPTPSAT